MRESVNSKLGFPGGSEGKESAYNADCNQETQVQSLGQEDPLEKEMTTHSSIITWKIPWKEELYGLQSRGCKESDMTG